MNYLIDRWGKTSSNRRSAAISLIIREVMSDSRGQLPRNLKVGQAVKRPSGQFPSRVLKLARTMWDAASKFRGAWKLHVSAPRKKVVVGQRVKVRLALKSAAKKYVPGVRVRLTYRGPVTGPKRVRTGRRAKRFAVRTTGKGRFTVIAHVRGPAFHGRLLDPRRTRVQRGWIAEKSRTTARTKATFVVVPRIKVTVKSKTSAQRSTVGDSLRDTVIVSGIKKTRLQRPVTVHWTLHGPLAPRGDDCTGLDWSRAAVRDEGTLTVTRDGSYETEQTMVNETGCYTYSEEVPRTRQVVGHSHPAGLVEQTTLVSKVEPRVHTRVNRQLVTTGGELRDRVKVTGLKNAIPARVRWTLHGPLKPRNSNPVGDNACANLNWDRAPIFDRGSFVARRNRTYTTRFSKLIRTKGCYTYSERVVATPKVEGRRHEPGIIVQSSLAKKPRTFEVDAGYAALAMARGTDAKPNTLHLPDIGSRNNRVEVVGNGAKRIQVPGSVGHVGWWRQSTPHGGSRGSSVIVGHVSDRSDRPGALYRLARSRKGHLIRWTMNGKTKTFRVTAVTKTKRHKPLPSRVWNTGGRQRLNIISCAHKVTRPNGSWHYTHNVTVTAVLVR